MSSSGIFISPNRQVKGKFVLVQPQRPVKNVGEYTLDDFTYFEKKWIQEMVERHPNELSNEKILYLFAISYEEERFTREGRSEIEWVESYIDNTFNYVDTFGNPNYSITGKGENIYFEHLKLEGVADSIDKLVRNRFLP
jgi:hypothetical protein